MSEAVENVAGPPEGVRALSVSTAFYYAFQPPDTGLRPDTPLCLVLHGWGQNCRYFLRQFDALRQANTAVLAPQGPHQFYLSLESRKVGFGWMTSFDRDRAIHFVVDAIDAALDTIEQEEGWRPSRLIVLGFSQGVAMAWRYACRGRRSVAGVIACGGDLPPDVEALLGVRPFPPALLVHGREDTIIPLEKALYAESALRAAGHPVETDYFDGAHDLPPSIVDHVAGWSAVKQPE